MPLKHERKCSSMYHSRADKAAAASVTPAGVISCARAEHRAPACAAQAREQEQQHVSQPSRQSRGEHRAPACAAQAREQEKQPVSRPNQRSSCSERHACYCSQLRTSRAASASLCCSSTRARAASCIEAELMKQRRRASRLGLRSAANEPSVERKPVLHKHESMSGIMYRSRAD